MIFFILCLIFPGRTLLITLLTSFSLYVLLSNEEKYSLIELMSVLIVVKTSTNIGVSSSVSHSLSTAASTSSFFFAE